MTAYVSKSSFVEEEGSCLHSDVNRPLQALVNIDVKLWAGEVADREFVFFNLLNGPQTPVYAAILSHDLPLAIQFNVGANELDRVDAPSL